MTDNHIDLESWEIFSAVMKTGSFLKAAKALSVDSSTVSRRLKRMEETFRVQLFYRDSTGVYPTAPARSIYDSIREVIDELSSLRHGTTELPSGFQGKLIVSVSPDLVSDALFSLFSRIELVHPGLEFEIVSGENVPEAHIVLSLGDLVPSGFRTVAHLTAVCAVTPSYIERRGMPQSPEDLPDHPLIMGGLGKTALRAEFRRGDERLSIPLSAAFLHRTARMAFLDAQQGGGIAAGIPFHMAENVIKKGEMIPVPAGWTMGGPAVSVKLRMPPGSPFLGSYLEGEIEQGLADIQNTRRNELARLMENSRYGAK